MSSSQWDLEVLAGQLRRHSGDLSLYAGFLLTTLSSALPPENQELDTLSQAMYHARELAMTRMEAEADVLGADGIVAVRLAVELKEWGSDIVGLDR